MIHTTSALRSHFPAPTSPYEFYHVGDFCYQSIKFRCSYLYFSFSIHELILLLLHNDFRLFRTKSRIDPWNHFVITAQWISFEREDDQVFAIQPSSYNFDNLLIRFTAVSIFKDCDSIILQHQSILSLGYARTSSGKRNRMINPRRILARNTIQCGEEWLSIGGVILGDTIIIFGSGIIFSVTGCRILSPFLSSWAY